MQFPHNKIYLAVLTLTILSTQTLPMTPANRAAHSIITLAIAGGGYMLGANKCSINNTNNSSDNDKDHPEPASVVVGKMTGDLCTIAEKIAKLQDEMATAQNELVWYKYTKDSPIYKDYKTHYDKSKSQYEDNILEFIKTYEMFHTRLLDRPDHAFLSEQLNLKLKNFNVNEPAIRKEFNRLCKDNKLRPNL